MDNREGLGDGGTSSFWVCLIIYSIVTRYTDSISFSLDMDYEGVGTGSYVAPNSVIEIFRDAAAT